MQNVNEKNYSFKKILLLSIKLILSILLKITEWMKLVMIFYSTSFRSFSRLPLSSVRWKWRKQREGKWSYLFLWQLNHTNVNLKCCIYREFSLQQTTPGDNWLSRGFQHVCVLWSQYNLRIKYPISKNKLEMTKITFFIPQDPPKHFPVFMIMIHSILIFPHYKCYENWALVEFKSIDLPKQGQSKQFEMMTDCRDNLELFLPESTAAQMALLSGQERIILCSLSLSVWQQFLSWPH